MHRFACPTPFNDLTLLSPYDLHAAAAKSNVFKVLTPVLSDLGIVEGEDLAMRCLPRGEFPPAFAIVAARAQGRLLLRQFVPPRLLITNSFIIIEPALILSPDIEIVAWLALDDYQKAH